jgi:hypothetical protein
MRLVMTVRRALRLVCVAVALFAPDVASAELPVAADFDGDGRNDAVTFDRTEPSVLRVWLTRTGTSAVIRSQRPLVGAIAADLDGDHRPELIVRDVFSRLHIWTRDSKQGFRKHAPQRPPQTTRRPSSRSIDGDQPDSPEALQGFRYTPDVIGPSAVTDGLAISRPPRARIVVSAIPLAPCRGCSFARPPPTLSA